uniref:(northern house mosquito) hypothetical protein n=1 Tax=Culex pipiens TaxID=7175 RepID=A0A8D8BE64_CULPI
MKSRIIRRSSGHEQQRVTSKDEKHRHRLDPVDTTQPMVVLTVLHQLSQVLHHRKRPQNTPEGTLLFRTRPVHRSHVVTRTGQNHQHEEHDHRSVHDFSR